MAQQQQKVKLPSREPSSSSAKNSYLIAYNALSALLWAMVLERTVTTNLLYGYQDVFTSAGELVKWVQTLMFVDILHALFGVVKTAPFTTMLQVLSRLNIIWLIQVPLSQLCTTPVYSTMLFAWSLTEVIRYSFLVCKLSGWEPAPFVWLRYSSWIPLYPLGIASEMIHMWWAVVAARDEGWGAAHQYFMIVCFFGLWPYGTYQLVPHMAKQRRKVLAELKAKDGKATQ